MGVYACDYRGSWITKGRMLISYLISEVGVVWDRLSIKKGPLEAILSFQTATSDRRELCLSFSSYYLSW